MAPFFHHSIRAILRSAKSKKGNRAIDMVHRTKEYYEATDGRVLVRIGHGTEVPSYEPQLLDEKGNVYPVDPATQGIWPDTDRIWPQRRSVKYQITFDPAVLMMALAAFKPGTGVRLDFFGGKGWPILRLVGTAFSDSPAAALAMPRNGDSIEIPSFVPGAPAKEEEKDNA